MNIKNGKEYYDEKALRNIGMVYKIIFSIVNYSIIMSGERTTSVAIPIRGNKYGYGVPRNSPSKYLFELRLKLNNGETKIVRKIDDNRYTNLLGINDNINYENIQHYSIYVSIITDNIDNTYNTSGYLKTCETFFSNQDNNVYIEFNRLNNGKVQCTCRYVDYDNIGLSISPPF